MESEIRFYYQGNYDQAMNAALKLIPKTAKSREVKIVCGSSYQSTYRVTVKFSNHHVYAVITGAADIFDN